MTTTYAASVYQKKILSNFKVTTLGEIMQEIINII